MTTKIGRRALLAGVGLLVCAGVGCTPTTSIRKHPQFADRRAKISSVAVVPPEVEVIRVVFKGDNEPLPEEASRISARLPDLIAAELRRRGFTVKDACLDEQHFGTEPDLRFQTTQAQQAFTTASGQMYRTVAMKKPEAENFQSTLGPGVNPLADHADVDALIFVKMGGFKKSAGEVAKNVAVTILFAVTGAIVAQPTQGAGMRIALVDGATGDVLWANVAGTTGDFEGAGLEKMIKGVFKEFPP
jgi:hypothetical protein